MKYLVLSMLILLFVGSISAAQPKALEVSDGFGHTCSFDSAPSDQESQRPDWGVCTMYPDFMRIEVEEELKLTDSTQVSFCIDEVEKEEVESIQFRSELLYQDNPSNTDEWSSNNCNTWSLDSSYYTSDGLTFRYYLKNQDDVAFHNPSVGSDYMVELNYINTKMSSDGQDTQVKSYDSVTISESEYQKLKNQNPQDSETEVPEGQKLVDTDDWNELQEKVEEKNQQINELQQRISKLEQRVEELNSQLNRSEAEEGNRSGPPEGLPANQSNSDEDLPGNQQAEESRPGFVNSLLGSIFG